MSSFLPPPQLSLVRLPFLWGPVKHCLLRELTSSTTPPPQAETIYTKIYLSLSTLGMEFEVTCCSVIIFFINTDLFLLDNVLLQSRSRFFFFVFIASSTEPDT